MRKTDSAVFRLTLAALIAALYAAITVVLAPISYGPMQVRISEALTILPLFTPAAIPGLFVGCIIANIMGGAVILDVIFGSLATLIGAVGGYLLRFNRWLVPIPAIVANTVIVPQVLKYGYGVNIPISMMMIYILVGEVIGCFVLGEILATGLLKTKKVSNTAQPSGR